MKKCSLPQLGSYMTRTFLSQGLRHMVEQSRTTVQSVFTTNLDLHAINFMHIAASGFDHVRFLGRSCESGGVVHKLRRKPAIAQLVEHLTVDVCSYQMVPGSIPGGRIWLGASILA